MIYVHRDLTKIPPEKLAALAAVSDALDKIIDPAERKKFIADKQATWSTVRGELSAMSYDKCWYTEAKEGVSRYQTDHFRPHGRAKQASGELTAGYCWLSFDITNYRIVGQLTNSQNKEYSEETIGKGDWFPLLDPTTRATFVQRNTDKEIPLLLDPIDEDDPSKIVFYDNGEAHPSTELSKEDQAWVRHAIDVMGIKQAQLNGLRRAIWRDCSRRIEKYNRFFKKPRVDRTSDDLATLKELAEELRAMSSCRASFSATARQCLISNGLEKLIVRDEFSERAAVYHA